MRIQKPARFLLIALALCAQMHCDRIFFLTAEPPAELRRPGRIDLNGNGAGDVLAISAPGKTVGVGRAAGAVYLFEAAEEPNAATLPLLQTLLPANPAAGLDGSFVADDFGAAIAAGDFDGDGCDELAVGVPGEDRGATRDTGAVVIYDDAANATCPKSEIALLRPRQRLILTPSIGNLTAEERFGSSLAVGDFNGDGCEDLAVGAPGDNPPGDPRSGRVHLFQGCPSAGDQILAGAAVIDLQLANESPGLNDRFGSALASIRPMDAQCDGLAVAAVGRRRSDKQQAGAVYLFRSTCGATLAMQPIGVLAHPDPEDFDQFGSALSSGFFDDDAVEDLAVGARGDSSQGPGAGAVFVFSGDDDFSQDAVLRPQDFPALPDSATGFGFGTALVAIDMNHDGFDGLAIGAPGARHDALPDRPTTGAVYLASGEEGDLIARAIKYPPADAAYTGALYGAGLGTASIVGSASLDLAVGAPLFRDRGIAHIIPGTPADTPSSAIGQLFATSGQVLLSQNSVSTFPQIGAGFGSAFAADPRYRRRIIVEQDSMYLGGGTPCNAPDCGPGNGMQTVHGNSASSRTSLASAFAAANVDLHISTGGPAVPAEANVSSARLGQLRAQHQERVDAGDLLHVWCLEAVSAGTAASAPSIVGGSIAPFPALKAKPRIGCVVFREQLLEVYPGQPGTQPTFTPPLVFARALGFALNLSHGHHEATAFCQSDTLMSASLAATISFRFSPASKWHLGNHATRFVAMSPAGTALFRSYIDTQTPDGTAGRYPEQTIELKTSPEFCQESLLSIRQTRVKEPFLFMEASIAGSGAP